MNSEYKKGTPVTSRDGRIMGELTGSNHRCNLEGCNGLKVSTRWPDGKFTRPCTKGMDYQTVTGWKIL